MLINIFEQWYDVDISLTDGVKNSKTSEVEFNTTGTVRYNTVVRGALNVR